MAMDYWSFDQSAEGIQSVLSKPACGAAGADLIRDYHAMLRDRGAPVTHQFPAGEVTFSENGEMSLLYWHEGQLRAMEGDSQEAIELFRRALKPPEQSHAGWNEYVLASIAFLEGDAVALAGEREALSQKIAPGQSRINLAVVEGLIACFGRTYRDAYGAPECNRRPKS